jgi:hypothetical protein
MPALEIKATSSDPKGNFNKAVGMVDDAAEAGCKCAKFQCHIVDDEMIPNSLVPGNAKESTWDIFCRSFATKIARGCCSLQFLVLFLMVGFVALRLGHYHGSANGSGRSSRWTRRSARADCFARCGTVICSC